jgi:hypothetical protein
MKFAGRMEVTDRFCQSEVILRCVCIIRVLLVFYRRQFHEVTGNISDGFVGICRCLSPKWPSQWSTHRNLHSDVKGPVDLDISP